jgi:UDP-N-acetylmuramate--alanine ligase
MQINIRLSELKQVYFLGIGGIGMSALARWFLYNDIPVAGYDKTESMLTRQLSDEGMEIHYEDSIELIPEICISDPEKCLFIFTPAIPATHQEKLYLISQGINLWKRSQILGWITEQIPTLAVAGTHGKTTTSTMLAHILYSNGIPVTAFLGGISSNYQSNLILSNAIPDDTWFVVEADEFDRSFLQLYPDMAILTSTDADHLDIYGDASTLLDSFTKFVSQIKQGGRLFLRAGISITVPDTIRISVFDLENAEIKAENLKLDDGTFIFDAVIGSYIIPEIRLQMPGFHNVANALAAAAVAKEVGLTEDQIKQGLESFKGVARRFEIVTKTEHSVLIDDYAHHPTEIEAFLKSVRAMYPDKRILAIFQPHLFSRTRDFMTGFAASLGLADEVILLDIYPAREEPIAGINSERLLELIPLEHKLLLPKQRLLGYLANQELEVVCTIGAGDIDALVKPIAKLLK